MTKSTAVVTLATFTGLVLGFASNLVIAAQFGAGGEMDVFLAATALPLFSITIITGLLSSIFMPFLLERGQPGGADRMQAVSSVMTLFCLGSLCFCAAGILFSREIMGPLVPGFTPEKLDRAATLMAIMLPAVFLATVSELLSGHFYARNKFLLPSFTRVLAPLLTIVFALCFSDTLGATALALASLAASLLQAAVNLAGARALEGFRYRPAILISDPAVTALFRRAIPLGLSMLVYRSVPLYDRWLGSSLPDGSISILGYATRLLGAIQPVLVTGMALSFFPLMARQAADNDLAGVRESLGRSVRMLLFVSLPIAVLLALFGAPIIALLFQRGSFTPEDAAATHKALALYLFSLPSSLVGTMIGQGFLAVKDTRTPALVGLVETAFYMLLCWLLLPAIGLFAIPTAFSTYLFLSLTACILLLSRRLGQSLFAEILPAASRQACAVALAALGAYLLQAALPQGPILDHIPLAIGAILYAFFMRFVFRSRELDHLLALVAGRLRSLRAKPAGEGSRGPGT